MIRKPIILFVFLLFSLTSSSLAQHIPVYDFEELEPLLQKQNDTTYVINFWATWCIPCVKELPDFEKANAEFKNQKFKMILVSLDFKSQIEKSVIPFIKDKNIQSEVVVLSDPDANTWINKVNPEWTGSIPATIIYNRDFYFFLEGSMNYEEINQIIIKNLIKWKTF